MHPRPEEVCSHCGESFRLGRSSCPHCGSDAETGWQSHEDQDAAIELGATSLEDDEYRAFLEAEGIEAAHEPEREDGRRRAASGAPGETRLPVTAIVLLLLLVAGVLYLLVRDSR